RLTTKRDLLVNADRPAPSLHKTTPARPGRILPPPAARWPAPRATTGAPPSSCARVGAGRASRRSSPSHLQDDRQHDGLALEALVDELPHGRAHEGADGLAVPRGGGIAAGHRSHDRLLDLVDERPIFLH